MIGIGDKLKITKVETFFVKPRWLFLKIHTNAGIIGLGEPIVEGRAKTFATAIEELDALSHRQRSAARRASLAGDVSARVLSRRADSHQRHQRHRAGALGHQGQSAGRAGL